jgi:hypothetical protein
MRYYRKFEVASGIGGELNAGMQEPQEPKVLALVRDLMFSSRITSMARATNVDVRVIRDPQSLADEPGRLLLVDLNLAGAIDAAANWRQATGGKVVGFVSHVDTETIDAAREKGLDQVMARSAFVQALPSILSGVRGG